MAKQYPKLQPLHHAFIARQRIFFTATAASAGRVNISPRAPTRYVRSDEAIAYLDRTGSGNERRICGAEAE
jgi:hypothetical protein